MRLRAFRKGVRWKMGTWILGGAAVLVGLGVFFLKAMEVAYWKSALPAEVETSSPALSAELRRLYDRVSIAGDPERAVVDLAMTYHANRLYREAESLYLRLLEKRSDEPKWQYLLSDVYRSTMDFAAYEDHLRRFLDRDDSYAPALLAMGNLELRSGNLREAEQLFLDTLELVPGAKLALDGLSRLRRQGGFRGTTLEGSAHGDLVEHVPDPWMNRVFERSFDVGQLLVRADAAVYADDFHQAFRFLDRASDVSPNDWKPWVMRSNVQARRGRLEEAVAAYREAIHLGADAGRALEELAPLLIERGESERLVSLAGRALGENPDSGELLQLMAKGLRAKGDWLEAERRLRRAARLLPGSGAIRLALGEVLWERGERAAAATHFRVAADLDPRDSKARSYLAQYYIDREQLAAAETYVEEALRLEPKNETWAKLAGQFFLQYGASEARSGNWSEVERLLERRGEIVPSGTEAVKLLAKALVEQGKRSEAIRLLARQVENGDAAPELSMALGDLYLENGDGEAAREQFERAIKTARGKTGYAGLLVVAEARLRHLIDRYSNSSNR